MTAIIQVEPPVSGSRYMTKDMKKQKSIKHLFDNNKPKKKYN